MSRRAIIIAGSSSTTRMVDLSSRKPRSSINAPLGPHPAPLFLGPPFPARPVRPMPVPAGTPRATSTAGRPRFWIAALRMPGAVGLDGGRDRGQGQPEREGRSGAHDRMDGQASAVACHNIPADRQPKAGAGDTAGAGRHAPVEPIEDVLLFLVGDTGPGVAAAEDGIS